MLCGGSCSREPVAPFPLCEGLERPTAVEPAPLHLEAAVRVGASMRTEAGRAAARLVTSLRRCLAGTANRGEGADVVIRVASDNAGVMALTSSLEGVPAALRQCVADLSGKERVSRALSERRFEVFLRLSASAEECEGRWNENPARVLSL